MRVLDLGCGSGVLTAEMHRELAAATTLGLDNSAEMLANSDDHKTAGVSFECRDLTRLSGVHADLVFSNAALHWLTDHNAVFDRVASMVTAGGQLAVQVPANHDETAHLLADEIAQEAPFATKLGGFVRGNSVEHPRWYDHKLRSLGFTERRVEVRIYPCELESADGVIQWLRGSLLTAYQTRMSAADFESFVGRFRERLFEALGQRVDERPFYYPYARILMWARRSAT
ncbi:MAG: trans-aconitate 2-methyltransferase [Myxococcota bacterium]|jgi:trans-aconitate 2-methyltransferase